MGDAEPRYSVPQALEARARRALVMVRAAGAGLALGALLLGLGPWGTVGLAVAVPLTLLGLAIALRAHGRLTAYNGFTIAPEGVHPPFRAPWTPRGQRTYLPSEAMDRITVHGGPEGFTAAIVLRDGRGVVVRSRDLVAFLGPSVEAEFPAMAAALEGLGLLVNDRLRP